ncbi:unnamed protein product [Fusarium equiseti]|uniref:Uncharacterized protein n=1 Tax=Fusarium equiseti TaxID=61235 RepID=A0A8J2J9I7_FUSEQ|nr:unnamed protein product [Fusarium equiseti]
MEDLEAIEVILQDPPFAQVYEDSKRYELPKLKEGPADRLSGFMADIVRFYKSQGKSGIIRRKRLVQEVIYGVGPKEIMNTTMKSLNNIVGKDSGLPGHTMDTKAGPHFTWVHLPSTNMDWMNDLLMRIMKDEQHDVWQFRDARSFFRDSWAEVPDESTQSRIMRPRTVTKRRTVDADGPEKATIRDMMENWKKEEEEGEERNVRESSHKGKSKISAASATYIPYLCFSTNYRPGTVPSENQRKYENLLEPYNSSGNHRSPTLDEWYYHFGNGHKSQEDKNHRNETQVVTKFAKNDEESTEHPESINTGKSKPDNCGQMADNRYILFAKKQTSEAADLSHRLYPGWLRRSLTIAFGCMRDPKLPGQTSIGQTYSHYMNKLSRDETALFNEFRRQSESYHQTETPEHSSRASHQASSGLVRDDDIRTALKEAEMLYSEIKDFRDEVNILSSVAQYQLAVQKRLPGNKVKAADLSASYVLGDLEKMDRVANRIELAVNTTLSLQQSEISSRQATLATQQALQSTEQGKILMAFTFATLLFLPLPFLSSLFALDVSSFQQTPAWAFTVLFLVAVAVSLFLGLVATNWNRTIPVIKGRVSTIDRNSSKSGSSSSRDERVKNPQMWEDSGENAANHRSQQHSWFRSRTRRTQLVNEC